MATATAEPLSVRDILSRSSIPKPSDAERTIVAEMTRQLRDSVASGVLYHTEYPRFIDETRKIVGEVRTGVLHALLRALGFWVVPRYDLHICCCCCISCCFDVRRQKATDDRFTQGNAIDSRFQAFYTVVVPFSLTRCGWLAISVATIAAVAAAWLQSVILFLCLALLFVLVYIQAGMTHACVHCGLCAPSTPQTVAWAEAAPRDAELADEAPPCGLERA